MAGLVGMAAVAMGPVVPWRRVWDRRGVGRVAVAQPTVGLTSAPSAGRAAPSARGPAVSGGGARLSRLAARQGGGTIPPLTAMRGMTSVTLC